MRTLSVIAEMGSGGAETVVADLTTRLVAAGHEPGVASSGGWRADQLSADGVRTLAVPLRDPGPAALVGTVLRLRRELGRRPVDLVHTHNVRATVATAGTRRAPRVLTTVHGLDDADYSPAARVLRRCSDVVVAVSDDVAARLVSGGLPEGRVVVVENAVPDPAPADGASVRAELGLGSEVPLVLCVARLAAPKRVDLLVDGWSDVPDAVLVVAGDGPGRRGLEQQVRDVSRVRLLGDRRDIGRLLAAADLLVLPSDREGLPMSVLEAMAAGVPVVASAVGGLTSLDPRAITLVPAASAVEHAAALAGGVRGLLGDPARREQQAGVARSLVARRFSSDRMWHAYESLYENLAIRLNSS